VNGLFLYVGDRVRDVSSVHAEAFRLTPSILQASWAGSRALVSVFHHEEGLNAGAAVHAARDEVRFIQGYFADHIGRVDRASDPLFDRVLGPGTPPHGSFNAGRLDLRARTIEIRSDAVGTLPLYVYRGSRELFVSTRVDAIASAALEPLTPNARAALDILTVGCALAGETRYEEVTLLPHALDAVVDVDSARVEVSSTWSPACGAASESGLGERADVIHRVLGAAVAHGALAPPERVFLGLSGGMDSRTVYALAPPGLRVYTMGFGGSPERRFAAKVLAAAPKASRSDALEITPDLVARGFDDGMRQMDGHGTTRIGYAPVLFARFRAEGARAMYDTLPADATLGGSYISKPYGRPSTFLRDLATGARETPFGPGSNARLAARVAEAILYETPAEVRSRLGDVVDRHARARGKRLVDLALRVAPRPVYEENLSDVLNLFVGAWRGALRSAANVNRAYVDTSFPFLDRAVVDACLATRPSQRSWRRVYRALYRRHLPAFARIPATSTGHARPSASTARIVARTYAEAALRRFGAWPARRSYVDYAGWFERETRFREAVSGGDGAWSTWSAALRQATLNRWAFEPKHLESVTP